MSITSFCPKHWLAAIIVVLLLPHVATAAPTCADPRAPLNTDVSITLDPSTTWQPRGGLVRFVVESKSQTLVAVEQLHGDEARRDQREEQHLLLLMRISNGVYLGAKFVPH